MKPSGPDSAEKLKSDDKTLIGTDAGQQSEIRARELLPGDLVEGRYRVVSLLGKGGMGSVYRVEQVVLKQARALKIINPDQLSEVAWRRFQKEAKAASLLDHPNLIKVHDFGMVDEHQPFFVMDLFEGETLTHLLKTKGPMPLETALPFFIQVSFALAYAHQQGVIHRDLKPGNIMFKSQENRDDEIKVVDFGLAKLTTDNTESMALTRTGEIFGTPYYMSPEQCVGEKIDHRSDIYSLGCVMFEALTGVPPFEGETALTTMMQHQSNQPPTLREASLGKVFPESLEAVVAKLLRKDRETRYQDLLQVASDLNRIKMGERLHSASQPPTKPPKQTRAMTVRADVAAIVVLAVAALSALATLMLARQHALSPEEATGRSFGSRRHVERRLQKDTDNQPRTALGSANTNGTAADQKQEYFSSILPGKPGTRVFHFPVNVGRFITAYGETFKIKRNGKVQGVSVDAEGELVVEDFKPLRLRVGDYLVAHPEYFKRFRPDELRAVEFHQSEERQLIEAASNLNPGDLREDHKADDKEYEAKKSPIVTDLVAKNLAGLKSLQDIDLRESEHLTDASLPYLAQLPKLERLTLSFSGITGVGLAKFGGLSRLRHLRTSQMLSAGLFLRQVKKMPQVLELAICESDLSDADLAYLTPERYPALVSLDVRANPAITDAGLAKLVPLKELNELDMSFCSLTPACIATVKKFPKLGKFYISRPGWSLTDRELLRTTVKKCDIYVKEQPW